jgi:hypothetical protein
LHVVSGKLVVTLCWHYCPASNNLPVLTAVKQVGELAAVLQLFLPHAGRQNCSVVNNGYVLTSESTLLGYTQHSMASKLQPPTSTCMVICSAHNGQG